MSSFLKMAEGWTLRKGLLHDAETCDWSEPTARDFGGTDGF